MIAIKLLLECVFLISIGMQASPGMTSGAVSTNTLIERGKPTRHLHVIISAPRILEEGYLLINTIKETRLPGFGALPASNEWVGCSMAGVIPSRDSWPGLVVAFLLAGGLLFWSNHRHRRALRTIKNIQERYQQLLTDYGTVQQSEARWKQIFTMAPIPLACVTYNGLILDINNCFDQQLGYDHTDIPDMNAWWDRAYPDQEYRVQTMEAWNNTVHRAMTDGADIEPHEYRITRKDGSTRIMVVGGALGKDIILVNFFDITSRKQAEEALRASENLSRALFEQAHQFVGLLDTKGRILKVNRSALKFAGISLEMVVGRNFWETPWWPDKDEASRICHEGFAEAMNGKVFQREVLHAGAAGSSFIIDFVLSPITDDTGSVSYFIAEGRDITVIRRAQDALAASEKRFRAIFDNAPYAIVINDIEDGRYLEVNKAFLDTTGLSEKESLLAKADDLILTTEDEIDRIRGELLCNGAARNCEALIRKPDGSQLDILFSSVLLEIQEQMHVLSMVVDLTAHKHMEQQLRESEERFKLSMEATNDGLWDWDIQTDKGYFSPAYYSMLGYDIDSFPKEGVAWVELMHPGDREKAIQANMDCIEGRNDRFQVEFRMKASNGEWLWILGRGKCISRDEQGRALRMVGTHVDITARKQAEEELLREQLLMKKLLDSLPGIFYLYTYPELRLVRWNKNHESLLGYEPGEIKDRSILEWHVPEAKQAVLDAVEVVMNKGQNAIESPLLSKEGRPVPFLMTGVKLETPGQDYLMGVGIDITEHKRLEAERGKLQEQLAQSQKMDSVGRLAGGVAHDFNNMLGAILAHIELAMSRLEPAHPIHDDLDEIRKAAIRSADLTRQLLAFARKQTVAPRVLDLNEAVTGMLRMLQRLIGEDIELSWLPGVYLWPVKVDPSQIDQILANLCVNARDAIADVGKIIIETGNAVFDDDYCATHADFTPGEYVRLTVSDTGNGMDKETLARIFEPFFTTKELGKGTGLGLATVYGAVKQNSGAINIYSEPGSGTAFTIYLPRHADEAAEPRMISAISSFADGQETILLVEDEPAILRPTTLLLSRQGYTVLAACGPREAIRLAHEHIGAIHLLMTDVVMPGMNGRDLSKSLLTLYPNIKVLFMSGYTANVIAHHGVLDKGVHFIQKPFTLETLCLKVREALEGP